MSFSTKLGLREQMTSVLVELYKKIPHKADRDGNVNPLALKILEYLNQRGYDVKTLIEKTF